MVETPVWFTCHVGGHDRFYSTSDAITNEFRFDITSQINDKIRARLGVDLKSHKLNFYEVSSPWEDVSASRQRFAEQWDDYGHDGWYWLDFPGDEFIDCDSGTGLCSDDDGWNAQTMGNGTYDSNETIITLF